MGLCRSRLVSVEHHCHDPVPGTCCQMREVYIYIFTLNTCLCLTLYMYSMYVCAPGFEGGKETACST